MASESSMFRSSENPTADRGWKHDRQSWERPWWCGRRLKVRRYWLVCDSWVQYLCRFCLKSMKRIKASCSPEPSGPKFGVWIGKAEETQNKHWKQLFCPGSLCTDCDYEPSHLANQPARVQRVILMYCFWDLCLQVVCFLWPRHQSTQTQRTSSCLLFIVLQIQLLWRK